MTKLATSPSDMEGRLPDGRGRPLRGSLQRRGQTGRYGAITEQVLLQGPGADRPAVPKPLRHDRGPSVRRGGQRILPQRPDRPRLLEVDSRGDAQYVTDGRASGDSHVSGERRRRLGRDRLGDDHRRRRRPYRRHRRCHALRDSRRGATEERRLPIACVPGVRLRRPCPTIVPSRTRGATPRVRSSAARPDTPPESKWRSP